jgi:ribosome-interacting GTPase 1
MASTNQSPFYQRAEHEYLEATNDEERIRCLEIMIKECPKHKSSENMLSNLKNRLRRLKESLEKQKKSGKSTKIGIKKADMQCVLSGPPNTGKSSLFNLLTGLNAKTSQHPFTTTQPQLGTFNFEDAQIQIIDAAPFPGHDKSLLNSTDTILLVIDSLDQIKESEENLYRAQGKVILILNKVDLLNEQEKRKIEATLNSKFKRFNYILFSVNEKDKNKIQELKKKIFETFPIIRVYTKEPKKEASKEPMILKQGATIEAAAEKILKGLSKKIARARVWGPSSKFGGQVVGLDHNLKDKDVIEFQVK